MINSIHIAISENKYIFSNLKKRKYFYEIGCSVIRNDFRVIFQKSSDEKNYNIFLITIIVLQNSPSPTQCIFDWFPWGPQGAGQLGSRLHNLFGPIGPGLLTFFCVYKPFSTFEIYCAEERNFFPKLSSRTFKVHFTITFCFAKSFILSQCPTSPTRFPNIKFYDTQIR